MFEEWKYKKKRQYRNWVEDSSLEAKVGAGISGAILLVLFILAPLQMLLICLISYVFWLVFMFIASLAD